MFLWKSGLRNSASLIKNTNPQKNLESFEKVLSSGFINEILMAGGWRVEELFGFHVIYLTK